MSNVKKIVVISASRNARAHQDTLCRSIDEQTIDEWEHILIDDVSDDDKRLDVNVRTDPRRRYIMNDVRKYALRNIVEVARTYQDDDDVVIATVDGDDELCNENALKIVVDAYNRDDQVDVVWTAHKWDIRDDVNISRPLPNRRIDVYEWPWCTSHLRTFRASLLRKVSNSNFLDHKGEWFKRGYDQILMLPILTVARRKQYVPEVCYMYRMNSVTIPLDKRAGTEVEQIRNIAFVRARGFLHQ